MLSLNYSQYHFLLVFVAVLFCISGKDAMAENYLLQQDNNGKK